MILSYNQFLTEGNKQTISSSAFTEDERLLFEDLLIEYVDKYHMIQMPFGEMYGGERHYFDDSQESIQYLVYVLGNIAIDIESIPEIKLDDVYHDIKTHFVPRVERYGYSVFHCSLEQESDTNVISITITKQ